MIIAYNETKSIAKLLLNGTNLVLGHELCNTEKGIGMTDIPVLLKDVGVAIYT